MKFHVSKSFVEVVNSASLELPSNKKKRNAWQHYASNYDHCILAHITVIPMILASNLGNISYPMIL